jgi:hypothetical protein
MVSAPSRRAAKIPSIESSIAPSTKQLNSVTRRPVPAPARMRPPGRKRPEASSWKKRSPQAGSRSAAATAVATRRKLSSGARSSAPSVASR